MRLEEIASAFRISKSLIEATPSSFFSSCPSWALTYRKPIHFFTQLFPEKDHMKVELKPTPERTDLRASELAPYSFAVVTAGGSCGIDYGDIVYVGNLNYYGIRGNSYNPLSSTTQRFRQLKRGDQLTITI